MAGVREFLHKQLENDLEVETNVYRILLPKEPFVQVRSLLSLEAEPICEQPADKLCLNLPKAGGRRSFSKYGSDRFWIPKPKMGFQIPDSDSPQLYI